MIVGLTFLLPVVFALFDLHGANMWQTIGGWSGEAYEKAGSMYQSLLWGLCYVFIAFIAIGYYILRRDFTESFALFIVPTILFQFGVEDVLYYLFSEHQLIGDKLPWLHGNLLPITWISEIFNGGIITGSLVLISSIMGIIIALGVAKLLEKW